MLQVGFADGRLRIFDTAAAVLAGEMRQHRTGVQSVAFDAAGARLYTAGTILHRLDPTRRLFAYKFGTQSHAVGQLTDSVGSQTWQHVGRTFGAI